MPQLQLPWGPKQEPPLPHTPAAAATLPAAPLPRRCPPPGVPPPLSPPAPRPRARSPARGCRPKDPAAGARSGISAAAAPAAGRGGGAVPGSPDCVQQLNLILQEQNTSRDGPRYPRDGAQIRAGEARELRQHRAAHRPLPSPPPPAAEQPLPARSPRRGGGRDAASRSPVGTVGALPTNRAARKRLGQSNSEQGRAACFGRGCGRVRACGSA